MAANGTDEKRAIQPRLFEREALRLEATGQGRLRRLIRRPTRPPSRHEARREEDERTMRRLRGWGAHLADLHGLRIAALDPEKDGVHGHYGICYEDGVIRIRLRHARTGRLLKESSLVDTLCHELAHLRHMDHSLRFRRLYQKILTAARRLGYYRPGPGAADRVHQLSLFDAGTCGAVRPRATTAVQSRP